MLFIFWWSFENTNNLCDVCCTFLSKIFLQIDLFAFVRKKHSRQRIIISGSWLTMMTILTFTIIFTIRVTFGCCFFYSFIFHYYHCHCFLFRFVCLLFDNNIMIMIIIHNNNYDDDLSFVLSFSTAAVIFIRSRCKFFMVNYIKYPNSEQKKDRENKNKIRTIIRRFTFSVAYLSI